MVPLQNKTGVAIWQCPFFYAFAFAMTSETAGRLNVPIHQWRATSFF